MRSSPNDQQLNEFVVFAHLEKRLTEISPLKVGWGIRRTTKTITANTTITARNIGQYGNTSPGRGPCLAETVQTKSRVRVLVMFRHAQQEQEVIYLHKCLTFTPI